MEYDGRSEAASPFWGRKALAHENTTTTTGTGATMCGSQQDRGFSARVQFSPWKTLYCPSWETASFPRHLSGLPKKKQEQRFTCEPHTPRAGTSRPREKNPRTQNTSHERVNISKKTTRVRRRPVRMTFPYLSPTPPILSSLSAFSFPGCVQKRWQSSFYFFRAFESGAGMAWHGRVRAREGEREHSQKHPGTSHFSHCRSHLLFFVFPG